MKCLYLYFSVALVAGAFTAKAQFQPSATAETDYPTANVPFRCDNTSAYSYGNLVISGHHTNLYVFTWDRFANGTGSPGAGLAIRQSTPFVQSYDPVGFPVGDAASVEAVILQQNGKVFVLATYYWISHHGFYVDLYQYVGGGVLLQQSGYPQNITATGTAAPLAWIHLDAHDLNEYVITWQEQGQVLAKAGTANSGFAMGNTAIVDNSSISLGAASQPDVALVYSQQAGNRIRAHFVYTSQSTQRLIASSLRFDDILNAPSPLAMLTPVFDDDINSSTSQFKLPRIDAPDDHLTDDWSYVVMQEQVSIGQELIYAGVMANATLNHFKLNDGSLSPSLPDISSIDTATLHLNYQPVVAYDSTGNNIYYCWDYYSSYFPPNPSSDRAYIGLKIDNAGNLLGSPFQYRLAQQNPQYTSPASSIALSGQNTTSPGLFMAFTQVQTSGYYMTTKTIPWTQNSFRPGQPEGVASVNSGSGIRVAPNPFSRSFQLDLVEGKGGAYGLSLRDALGRGLMSLKGDISRLNAGLAAAGLDKLPPGDYFLTVWAENDRKKITFKLLKIK